MDLILPLKKKWFEAIKEGSKDFEYRLDNEYWRKRLVGKTFDSVVFTLGYPKSNDQDRRIIKPWAGYEMQNIIHEEWGEIQQRVFAIRILAPLDLGRFKTSRRGWLGNNPLGADYMPAVNERARRMKAAVREQDQPADKRQLRLPGF